MEQEKTGNLAFDMIIGSQSNAQDNKQEGGEPAAAGGQAPANPEPENQNPGGEPKKTDPAAPIVQQLDASFQPIVPKGEPAATPTEPQTQGEPASTTGEPTAEPTGEPMSIEQRISSILSGRLDSTSFEDQLSYLQGAVETQDEVFRYREDMERKDALIQELQGRLSNQDSDLMAAAQFKKDTGIADYGVYNMLKDLDVDNIGAKQAIEVMSKIKSPGLSNEDLQFKMDRKYKQGEEFDEADQKLGQIEMKEDAHEAKNYLKELKGKITTPEVGFDLQARESEMTEKLNVLKEDWDNAVESAFANTQNPKFDIGNNNILEMTITPQEIETMKDDAWEFAVENGLDPTDQDSYAVIGEYVQNMYIQNNWQRMLAAAREQGFHAAQQSDKKELHNPSALDDKRQQSTTDTRDISDMAFEWANSKK